MRKHFLVVLGLAALLLSAAPAVAQQGVGNECTLAGTWYGGSVVAYQMTIIPAGPAGHFVTFAQGMYKDAVLNTIYSGNLAKVGPNLYEGSMMQLATQDPVFLDPPPAGKMPDIMAGWSKVKLVDCNTFESTIPAFGMYAGSKIWLPGVVWLEGGSKPLVDAPDLDLVVVLNGGKPIVETYHRLPTAVKPELLHK